jgi:hypothetical protein
MTFCVAGSNTSRFTNPVANMVAIGARECHRLDVSSSPDIPEDMPARALPGKVKARRAGRIVCRPK